MRGQGGDYLIGVKRLVPGTGEEVSTGQRWRRCAKARTVVSGGGHM